MTNPNPAHITDAMWRLWTDRPDPTWRLGGFYADKKAYHNTVIANLEKWPGNYSIQLPLDLVSINRDKARAFDFTMSTEKMKLYTKRLRDSALDPMDHRLAAMREFYGTLDGETVFGLIKNNEYGPWKESTADLTHVWHIHGSIFTAFVHLWNKMSPILSVFRGEKFIDWESQAMLSQINDVGEVVKYWQQLHNIVRATVNPASPNLTVDGKYGPSSAAAFFDFWKKSGGIDPSGNYKGQVITGWLAIKYNRALMSLHSHPAPILPTPPSISSEQIQEEVNKWMLAHPEVFKFKPPTSISFDARVTDYSTE